MPARPSLHHQDTKNCRSGVWEAPQRAESSPPSHRKIFTTKAQRHKEDWAREIRKVGGASVRRIFTTKARGRDSPQRHKNTKKTGQERSGRWEAPQYAASSPPRHGEEIHHKGTKTPRRLGKRDPKGRRRLSAPIPDGRTSHTAPTLFSWNVEPGTWNVEPETRPHAARPRFWLRKSTLESVRTPRFHGWRPFAVPDEPGRRTTFPPRAR